MDGRVRVVEWRNARRRQIPPPGRTITDVQECAKGLVALDDKSSVQNPAPGLEQYTPGGETRLRFKIMERGF